jgi:hypothetical protein
MPQITVTIPDDVAELVASIVQETGRSQSGLCASYIEEGVYRHIEQLTKIENWKLIVKKRKAAS